MIVLKLKCIKNMKKKIEFKKYKNFIIAYLLIFFSRLIFSFFLNSFGQDVARDLVVIDQHRQNNQPFFYYGPKASVANFYLPPAYYQIHYILSLATNNHPYTMKCFTVFLESFTPLILYFILKKIGLKKFAPIGAFLYAVSYLPANFGIHAWNPNTIPFLSTLFLLLMIIYLEKDQLKYLLLATLCLNLAIQFHYQGIVLGLFVAIIAIYQLICNFKKFWKNWMLAALVMLLMFTPYFIGELKNHLQNTQEIVNYFTGEHKNYYQRVSKPDYILTFIPSFFEMILIGKHQPYKIFGRVIFFVGFILWLKQLYLKRKFKTPSDKNLLLVFIYFVSILLMFRVYKGDKVNYYMSTIYPLPVILLAFLWQFKKVVMIPIIMIMVFLMGHQFAEINFKNDLKLIKEEIELLEKNLPKKEVALFFHNPEEINTYVYALDKFSTIKIDQNSDILVEVGGLPKLICNDVFYRDCRNSKTQVYTCLLKDQFKIKTLKSIELAKQERKFCINQLTQKLEPIDYQYNKYNYEYGSDVLIPEIARYNQ